MNSLCICPDTDAACIDEIVALEDSAQRRLAGRVRQFRLLAVAGGLVLRGRASTYYAKQLAQHAIMAATSVPILANEIEVSQSCRHPP